MMLRLEPPKVIERNGFACVEGQIVSVETNESWTVFVGIPLAHRSMITTRCDVFVPVALMFGTLRREQVDLSRVAADSVFVRNVHGAMKEQSTWRPTFEALPPIGELAPALPLVTDKKLGAFYSGGVDSLFSLVRHTQGRSAEPGAAVPKEVSYALHMFHREVPEAPETFAAEAETLKTGAAKLGATFIPIVTNIMTFDRLWWDWYAPAAHGTALASIAHVLSGELDTVLIGSTYTHGLLIPWGSHPMTDPLLSAPSLRVVHDGSTYTRVEKTLEIAQSPEALASLNVCDTIVKDVGYVNCSNCQKCLRTMITLDLAGKASNEACPSFDWTNYAPRQFSELFLRKGSAIFAREIYDEAEALGRSDIATATADALERGKRLSILSRLEQFVKYTDLGRRNRQHLLALRRRLYLLFQIE